MTFANSLDFQGTTPALVSLELIRSVPRTEGQSGPSDVAYPVEMVAPRSAAIGLLYRDLSYDPSVRKALPLVAQTGGVTMMPPRIDVFRHLRMLLVGSVALDGGSDARWVGASIDPSILATQALGVAPVGIRVSFRWDTDGQVLGTALGPGTEAEASILSLVVPVRAERTDWTLGLQATAAYDPSAVESPWRTFAIGLVRSVAVLYLDLDGFKDVNDVFGHQAGDRVLSESARRLERVVRPGDMVARMGGDEFVILCEQLLDASDAERIATRIVQAVGKPIPLASGVATVTASIGVALGETGETAGFARRPRRRRDVSDEAGREVGLPVHSGGRRLSSGRRATIRRGTVGRPSRP